MSRGGQSIENKLVSGLAISRDSQRSRPRPSSTRWNVQWTIATHVWYMRYERDLRYWRNCGCKGHIIDYRELYRADPYWLFAMKWRRAHRHVELLMAVVGVETIEII